MPVYQAEYDDYGPVTQDHIADSEADVREYYNLELPWLLPVVITEVESDEDIQE